MKQISAQKIYLSTHSDIPRAKDTKKKQMRGKKREKVAAARSLDLRGTPPLRPADNANARRIKFETEAPEIDRTTLPKLKAGAKTSVGARSATWDK